jgi:hypothetical protein
MRKKMKSGLRERTDIQKQERKVRRDVFEREGYVDFVEGEQA